MKKLLISASLLCVALSLCPVAGSAEGLELESATPIVVSSDSISARSVNSWKFFFKSVPPKSYKGLTRFYYEYSSKDKGYFGFYK